jgi:hypothetical protein
MELNGQNCKFWSETDKSLKLYIKHRVLSIGGDIKIVNSKLRAPGALKGPLRCSRTVSTIAFNGTKIQKQGRLHSNEKRNVEN